MTVENKTKAHPNGLHHYQVEWAVLVDLVHNDGRPDEEEIIARVVESNIEISMEVWHHLAFLGDPLPNDLSPNGGSDYVRPISQVSNPKHETKFAISQRGERVT